jgi:hypothetical protein
MLVIVTTTMKRKRRRRRGEACIGACSGEDDYLGWRGDKASSTQDIDSWHFLEQGTSSALSVYYLRLESPLSCTHRVE